MTRTALQPPPKPPTTITNNDREYLRLEYQSLRQEILALKERVIREFALGLTGVPIIMGAGFTSHYYLLLLMSPIIVVAGYLMLLFEQNSIMRAGTYIGVMIEDNLLDHPDLGWEDWLETGNNRQAEAFFHYSAATAFIIYYIVGALLAHHSSTQPELFQSFPWLPEVVKYFYGSVFLFAVAFVVKNFKTHNDLREYRRMHTKSAIQ